MKHTLKAKYAANGLSAHRQRVMASVPAEVARQREAARRQEVVDRVTARLTEPARPKFGDSTATMISAAALDVLKRKLALDYAKLGAQMSVYGTRHHPDDRADAIKYAFMAAPRCAGQFLPRDVFDLSAP